MSASENEPARPASTTAGEPPRNASTLEVVGAVFGSFLGIRKGRAMHKDAVTLRPHQVVIVGVVLAALLVVSLILLVRLILRSAGV